MGSGLRLRLGVKKRCVEGVEGGGSSRYHLSSAPIEDIIYFIIY